MSVTQVTDAEIEELVALAKDSRVQGFLDEQVHDAYSNTASALNNEGAAAQIRFLLEGGVYTKEDLADCLQENSIENHFG